MLGSPTSVVAAARSRLCRDQFSRIQGEIVAANRGAQLLTEQEFSLVQAGSTFSGRRASYSFALDGGPGGRLNLRSEVYVLCYAGGRWTVQYRFTCPENMDAGAAISDFMRDLTLTIRSGA
jgi:hypothetical protein